MQGHQSSYIPASVKFNILIMHGLMSGLVLKLLLQTFMVADKKDLSFCSGFMEGGDMAERPWALHYALLGTISAHDAKFDCHVTTCNGNGYTPIIHAHRWQQHIN